MSGTPKPHESAIRSTCTTITARRASGGPSSSNAQRASRSSKPGSPAWTTSPRPCRRKIFGGPSKAQNMTTMRPFSRTWAIVSAPLPITSRYATVRSSSTRRVPPGPFGEMLTRPSSASGALPTKNIGCRPIQSRQCWSISSYSRPMPLRLASGQLGSGELGDELGQPLGLVLGDERPAVGDLLDAGIREQLREPARVLHREEAVLRGPREQHRPVERVEPLGGRERVALVHALEQLRGVVPHALVRLARLQPAGGHVVGNAVLREPAERKRQAAER